MIKFQEIAKRTFDVVNIDGDIEKKIVTLNLTFSPAINKFEKISSFIENCSETMGKEFDDWFVKYLTDYIESEMSVQVIKDNIPQIIDFCDRYITSLEIDFKSYINKDKVSKTSIFFDANEIEKLVKVSCYLKLYFILSQDSILKPPLKSHKEIFSILVSDISTSDILHKLFKIVSSKTYRYNISDSYMWEYIKMIYCKTTDMHIMSIFNFLVNYILVTCDCNSNPIPFIISVVDESIQWILRSVYKDVVIYSEHVNTEDTYSVQGRDNLKTYAYNDSIGRLALMSFNCLETQGISDERFNEALKNCKHPSLFATYMTYPILCKVLKIPYRHFLTIPVEHSYLLNVLLYTYLPEEFQKKYPVISQMILYYNKERPIQKTTYKMKNIKQFTNTLGGFLGFKNMMFVYEFYSSIVGKLARNSYCHFKNDREINNFPLAKLENDIITFYNDYFDGRLDDMFEEIRNSLDSRI